ncbi:acyl-CoA N-acyltransferase [Achaetomium macrosporum]|uniref:Acyl-CoA N-acyltransferase n=1 Tax=Achaetomium macrosporum TaxID=79813 RepID=A0AAN7H9Y9_9PEZI|nr:acyl-CoA N-acyltransferase [Achaetomium macrosporum]
MTTWRQMHPSDLPSVMRIANEIHHALPETEAVFRERLHLYPGGCFVLVNDGSDDNKAGIGGYVISFPIRHGKPPALNAMLGEIPADADQYYLHDLAILPGFRGRGAARDGIGRVLGVARGLGYRMCCLISVYGTVPFWKKFGFEPEPGQVDEVMMEKLRGYGEEATYLVRRNTMLGVLGS